MLESPQGFGVYIVERFRLKLQLDLHDLLNLHQEPAVDFGEGKHLLHTHALRKRVTHVPDAIRAWVAEFALQYFTVLRFLVHAVNAHFQPAQGFLERLLEGAAHRHDFAHRLHLRRQARISGGEFLKSETRDFGDHVVNARLKTRRRGAAGDFIFQLIQGVAAGEFGRHFGNRETGGFGCERGGARDARVHLDHNHAAVVRVDGELHVAATGIHADFAQHGQRGIAQDLVFAVSQGLRRGDGDGVAGVHTHRVEVFDGADDDAVVCLVAHHLHLVFFPSEQGFFNQQLVGGGSFQAAFADRLELFGVVGNAATCATQGKAGADHGGETQRFLHAPGVVHAVGDAGARGAQADFGHRVLELATVFGLVDGFGRGANQLHRFASGSALVFVEHAVVPQIQRTVERGLPAHGRQNRIGPLFGDDFFNRLPGDGLDVGHVCRSRVGHDRRRVAVDQDDAVTFFAQRLAGLHARVIKLAGLANDDRTGADDEDALDVGSFCHYFSPAAGAFACAIKPVKRSNR